MLGVEKRIKALHGDEALGADEESSRFPRPKNWTVVAIVILACLVVGLYISLNLKIARIENKLSTLNTLDMQLKSLENRFADVAAVPEKTRQTLLQNYLAETSQKLSFLEPQLASEQQKALMKQISELMTQLQQNMSQ